MKVTIVPRFKSTPSITFNMTYTDGTPYEGVDVIVKNIEVCEKDETYETDYLLFKLETENGEFEGLEWRNGSSIERTDSNTFLNCGYDIRDLFGLSRKDLADDVMSEIFDKLETLIPADE